MDEALIKTHLIISDIHEEYDMRWCGKILNTKPKFKNGKPIFIIVGSEGRMEINTTDMARLEKCAKLLTRPRGRAAITSDTARIFIQEEDGNEVLLGILTHNHVKTYQQMYDKVGYY